MSLQYETFSQNVQAAYTRDQVEKMQKFGYSIANIEANAEKTQCRRRLSQAPLVSTQPKPTTSLRALANNISTGPYHQMGPFIDANINGDADSYGNIMPTAQMNDFQLPQTFAPFVFGSNIHLSYGQPLSMMPIHNQLAPINHQQFNLTGMQPNFYDSSNSSLQGPMLAGNQSGSSTGTNYFGLNRHPSLGSMVLSAPQVSGYQNPSMAPKAVMGQENFGIDPRLTLNNPPVSSAKPEPQVNDFDFELFTMDNDYQT